MASAAVVYILGGLTVPCAALDDVVKAEQGSRAPQCLQP